MKDDLWRGLWIIKFAKMAANLDCQKEKHANQKDFDFNRTTLWMMDKLEETKPHHIPKTGQCASQRL